MDWELYERYRSTLLLAGLLLVSSLLLAFQRTSSIQHLRSFLVRFALPPQRFLSQMKPFSGVPETSSQASPEETAVPSVLDITGSVLSEERRKVQVLNDENNRLRDILELKRVKWPNAVVAHVAGRDPQRWFQEIVLDKGKEEGLDIDFPVLAVVEGHEALVGRIVELSGHVSKVMLIQDSLSAVAATVTGIRGEDGVVEGTNSHELLLKFLDRGSQVKLGDLVVTSGLGKAFPPGIPLGWIETIEPDPRQLFLQAKLRPAAKSNQLRAVLVLTTSGAGA
jgi:rod shape-determining protein MreC